MKPLEKILIGLLVWLAFCVALKSAAGQEPTLAPVQISEIIADGQKTGTMEFPAGTFYDFPLVKMAGSGFDVSGRGKSGSPIEKPGWDRAITRLVDGGFVGPVNGFNFEKLTLVRQKIHIEAKKGTGSGQGVFSLCSFFECDITIGTDGENFNADWVTFRDCLFDRQTTVRNTESQNVFIAFENCTLKRCKPVFFLCDGGGKIFFDTIDVIDCGTMVRVSGNGSVFGPDNGTITFRNIDYDREHTKVVFDIGLPTQRADYMLDILVDDVNRHYGKGRKVITHNVNFHRSFPGVILRHSPKTEWERIGAETVFNKYVNPVPVENR